MGGMRTSIDEINQIRVMHGRGMNFATIGRKLNRSASFIGAKVREIEAGKWPSTVVTTPSVTPPATTRESELRTLIRTVAELPNMTPEMKLSVITTIAR